MKVALIRILGEDRHDNNTADYNVGLLYLKNSVADLDTSIDILDPLDPLDNDQMKELMLKEYSIIGFTVHVLNIVETLSIANHIKETFPTSTIVLGGHHVSATATEILNDCPFIDFICIGEGEWAFRHIVNSKLKNTIVETQKESKILHPLILRNLLNDTTPLKRDSVSKTERICTSLGCPYDCSFCTTPSLYKFSSAPTYRARTAQSVLNEIEYLISLGVESIYFNDDLFITPSKKSQARALEIADGIIALDHKIKYKTQLRADSVRPNQIYILDKLKKSGMHNVFIGIESASDKTLEQYNKRTTAQQNVSTIEMYNLAGIEVNAGNIMAAPDSTADDILESVFNFHYLGISYLFFRRVTFKVQIYPGTALESQLIQQDRLTPAARYLPREYLFADKRVGDVVSLLEERMPEFLASKASELFTIRSKYCKTNKKTETSKLDYTLSKWNDISKNFLVSWFKELPDSKVNRKNFNNSFNEYANNVDLLRKGFH